MSEIEVRIIGIEKIAGFSKAGKVIPRRLKEAVDKSTTVVANDTKKTWPVGVSGQSRNSIDSEVTQTGSTIVGKVGSSITTPYPYPLTIEYGRAPGRMPPPSSLYRWVELVLGVRGEQTKSVAFVVARKIGKRGIRGKFLLRRAWQSNLSRIRGFFESAVAHIRKDLTTL